MIRVNEEDRATKKPWYICATKRTILEDKDALYYKGTFRHAGYVKASDLYVDLIQQYGDCKRTSTHNGYLSFKECAVLPYFGKFGVGKILVVPYKPTKVKFFYFVGDEKCGK